MKLEPGTVIINDDNVKCIAIKRKLDEGCGECVLSQLNGYKHTCDKFPCTGIYYANLEDVSKFSIAEVQKEIAEYIISKSEITCAKINNSNIDNISKNMITCEEEKVDNVNNPSHYTSHPSGVECIDIIEHYDVLVANAIKYLWRAGLKVDSNKFSKAKEIEDLEKAIWYINRRINNLRKIV